MPESRSTQQYTAVSLSQQESITEATLEDSSQEGSCNLLPANRRCRCTQGTIWPCSRVCHEINDCQEEKRRQKFATKATERVQAAEEFRRTPIFLVSNCCQKNSKEPCDFRTKTLTEIASVLTLKSIGGGFACGSIKASRTPKRASTILSRDFSAKLFGRNSPLEILRRDSPQRVSKFSSRRTAATFSAVNPPANFPALRGC